jgi:hypothetical protein
MAEVVPNTRQEFWRSPAAAALEATPIATPSAALPTLPQSCAHCGSEYMIGAKFCHACGERRNAPLDVSATSRTIAGLWSERTATVRPWLDSAASVWRKVSFPAWMQYLHFHEIKRAIGLPTASLIAFMIGLGCVAGVVGVSLFYHASNLAEFQAIQMWRMEWLLGAAASFLAGILLKKPSAED